MFKINFIELYFTYREFSGAVSKVKNELQHICLVSLFQQLDFSGPEISPTHIVTQLFFFSLSQDNSKKYEMVPCSLFYTNIFVMVFKFINAEHSVSVEAINIQQGVMGIHEHTVLLEVEYFTL